MIVVSPVARLLRCVWGLVSLKYGFLAGLCLWAAGVHFVYRVPGRLIPPLLPWLGVGLSALHVAVLLRHLFARLADPWVDRVLHRVEQGAAWLALGFVAYSGALFVNGSFSPAPVATPRSEVVRVSHSEIDLGVVEPIAWVELRSWRTPGAIERVLLRPGEDRELWSGQRVILRLRWGYLLIPWVVAIERDDEAYYRRIIEHIPTAARAWKDLIALYLQRNQWAEATATTRDYLAIFPNDVDFAGSVASGLGVIEHPAEVRAVLETVLDQQPDYFVYALAGFALCRTGDPERGLPLLEAAIRLDPANHLAYEGLGIVYVDLGRLADAERMYEAALARNPNLPHVAAGLAELRRKWAAGVPGPPP